MRTLLAIALASLSSACQAGEAVPAGRQPVERDVLVNEPLPDENYLQWPLPESEARYAAIDGYRMKAYMDSLIAFSYKSRDTGTQYWGRIAGQPAHDEAKSWVADQFRRIGLEQVRFQQYDLPPQWMPKSWEASITAGGRTVKLETAQVPDMAVATPTGGLDLEAVWLGLGGEADFAGRDVRGKAAFVMAQPLPSPTRHGGGDGARRAQEAGAAALVWVSDVRGGNFNTQLGFGAGGNFSVPLFMVGRGDGQVVQEMIAANRNARVHLRSEIEMVPGLSVGDVYGVLPGETDENILVLAHYDAYFEGALDNASGVAGLFALAEHFAERPATERRRTMTFVALGGHHTGRVDINGTPTSAGFIAATMRPFLDRTALVLNVEHLGAVQTYPGGNNINYEQPEGLIYSNQISPRRWWISGSDALKRMVTSTWDEYGVARYAAMTTRPAGDLGSLFTLAPCVHVIEHVFYHTTRDTPDIVPAVGMERVVQSYARIVDEVNGMDLAEIREGLEG